MLKIDEQTFKTEKWFRAKVQEIKYTRIEKPIRLTQKVSFQKCNPYLYRNNPRHRYYYQDTQYKGGGLYRIRKIVEQNYKTVKDKTADGIIRILFVVNCHGQAGEFEVLELDNDYKLKSFNPKITDQLLDIVKGLQEWNPGINSDNNQAIDTYKYISFRLENGKITDIFP